MLKNKLYSHVIIIMTLLFSVPVLSYNPKPASGDLILSMPAGEQMVFRMVAIGGGSNIWATREFIMGDPFGGSQEHPTKVSISGSFLTKVNNRSDWVYYIGKYEITKEQYLTIMSDSKSESSNSKNNGLPITNISYFQAKSFINKYNQWLYKNAMSQLPKSGETLPYLRLPTEKEWEFAARGGSNVTENLFQQQTPYAKDISAYEWNKKNSDQSVHPTGLLKENPLGIYDLLGNVSEITENLYQTDYYQGRSSGFVSRGGNSLTSEKDIRSSFRKDLPYYQVARNELIENNNPILGFRVVLVSNVYTSMAVKKEYEQQWKSYRDGLGKQTPAIVSVAPVIEQTDAKNLDADKMLTEIEKDLSTQKDSSQLLRKLKRLELVLSDMQALIDSADEDSAYAWIKTGAESAFLISGKQKRKALLEQSQNDPNMKSKSALIEKSIWEVNQKISHYMESYIEILQQIAPIKQSALNNAYQKYTSFLHKNRAPIEQVEAFNLFKKQVVSFRNNKQIDKKRWLNDLEHLKGEAQ